MFQIKRGIFQGDTLSPLIFLVAFNLLIELCNKLPSCGFCLKLSVPNSSGLPPISSAIYVEWNESSSDEPPGWYYAVVREYLPDGLAKIEYPDQATEVLNLHSTYKERPKDLLPLSKAPPKFPLKKVREEASKPKLCLSSPHSVKGFADDLTVISSNIADHSAALLEIEKKAADLDLSLRPDKCVSVIYDGNRIDPKSRISLMDGSTRNISEAPSKILGHLLAVTLSHSRVTSAKKLESKLLTAVTNIDHRPIRGEYKT